MNINLNLYKYFYEVAKHDSFTKAAEELMISQPSLSYSVKVLEEQLDYKLFNRNKGKILLTQKGRQLYEKLDGIFKAFESIDETEEIKGDIYIGIRPLLAMYALPIFINHLVRLFPNISIKYKMLGNEELIEGLKNNQFDFIVDEYKYNDNKIVSLQTKDYDTPSGFVIGSRYYKDILIDEDYLKNNKIIISTKNKYSIDFMDKYPYVKYDDGISTPILAEKLLHSKEIAFSNLFVLKKEIESGVIKVLRTNLDLPKSNTYISYNKNTISKRVMTVINFLTEYKIEEIELLNKQNEDK